MQPNVGKVGISAKLALPLVALVTVTALAIGIQGYLAGAVGSTMIILVAWLALAGCALAAHFAIVTRHVSRPVANFAGIMSRYACNDITAEIEGCERPDEVGELARAFNVFKTNCQAWQVSDADAAAAKARQEEQRRREDDALIGKERELVNNSIGEGLAHLAANELSFRLTIELPEAYKKLQDDFNHAMEQLESALRNVRASTDAITMGTQEFSAASADLSRRTEQQAATLEETTAALDEITTTIGKTADGAKQASSMVVQARDDAQQSGSVVSRAIEAMGKIEKSSQEVNQIIGVIDEIAFQTNLLALNAGVEAARAGDAGRGFAVVASEVRALAQRSADAAKQIKSLISNSASEVKNGVKLVAETGESLSHIITKVSEINDVVSEIAENAKSQATSLQQVNTAVNQMDQATQQNAAMAEQATAQSTSLAQESKQLAQLVGQFSISGSASDGLRRELMKTVPHAFAKPAARPAGKSAAKKAEVAPQRSARKVAARGASSNDAADTDWSEF